MRGAFGETMKLASITLSVVLLAGSAFPTTQNDYYNSILAKANHALDALDEVLVMNKKLIDLHNPKVNAILSDELPKIQAKLRGE